MSEVFKNWAKSYSGFQGGDNGVGKVWFCGIEYGGKLSLNELEEECARSYPDIPSEDREECKKSLSYSFNNNILKITKEFLVPEIKSKLGSKFKCDEDLFSENSGIAKLNLFPMNFKIDYGDLIEPKEISDYCGFVTKEEYRQWCVKERFPELLKLRVTKRPKLIVCTSVSHILNYTIAFAGKNNIHEDIKKIEGSKMTFPKLTNYRSQKYCYEFDSIVEGNLTKILICPFIGGASGISSGDELSMLGQAIKSYLVNEESFSEFFKKQQHNISN